MPRTCGVVPGLVKGDRPAPAEAVRESTCVTASSQLPDPGRVSLRHVETDEATHSGQSRDERIRRAVV